MAVKTCTKCGGTKVLELFTVAKRAKDGRDTRCKSCAAAATRAYAKKFPEKVAAAYKAYRGIHKDVVDTRAKEWAKVNKEKRREHRKKWRDANLELAHAIEGTYRDANRDAIRARFKEYWTANKSKYAGHANKRRAAKLQAIPSWADPAAIDAIYVRCVEVSKTTGVPHEVDHIVPLLGKNVRGFHVEHNLQIIPSIDNRRKSNKWVDA